MVVSGSLVAYILDSEKRYYPFIIKSDAGTIPPELKNIEVALGTRNNLEW